MTTDDTQIEGWRKSWRDGYGPLLSLPALEALAKALREDAPDLIQGTTTIPYPGGYHTELCTSACAIAYAIWKGDEIDTVNKIEDEFGRICSTILCRTGTKSGHTNFLSWFDDTPRDECFRQLLPEVERSILLRKSCDLDEAVSD